MLLPLTGHRIKHRWGCRGGFPYTLATAPQPRTAPAREQQLALLFAAGIAAVSTRPMLRIPPSECAEAGWQLEKNGLHGQRFAVFLPGSQAAGWIKRWGAERFVVLGMALLGRGVDRIVVIGGPDEVDVCAEIVAAINAQAAGRAVDLNMLPLLQVVPVCESAVCIVANDTGNAHIAAAAGPPLYVLCGPTDPRRVKPVGDHVRMLQADFPCLGCYGKTCRIAAFPACMAALKPGIVADVVLGGQPDLSSVRVH